MARQGSTINPQTDVAAQRVLQAFQSARDAGQASVTCYRAGIAAWRRVHPDHSAVYAARQAVAVILAVKARLRIEE